MKKHLWLTGLLVVVLASPVRADKEPVKPVTIPFELLKTGHMTVMVKVNGKGPYKLIFDTGAPTNLLNNKIAKQAGLLKDAPQPLIPLFGSRGDVKVEELEVGGQKVTNVPAVVMDHPTVDAISQAFGPIDGIVGFPFFARFKMTLDYQTKTMTLVPSGFDPPDVMKALQTALLSGLLGEQQPIILSSAAQWGMVVDKKPLDENAGVTITTVMPGGAVSRAGLMKGDRLLTIDGRWTDTIADTFKAASFVKAGQTVSVVIEREGKKMTIKVTPLSGL